jgi:hypothetical protein
MNKKIFELLEAKFQGARKDGLQQLANSLALTIATDDEASAIVEKLTADSVDNYIKDWRKSADVENGKAAQTREESIRAKYELTEKQKQDQPTPQTPQNGLQPTQEELQRMINEAVANATKGLTSAVASITNSKLADTRRGQIEAIFTEQKSIPESYRKTVMQGFDGRSFENDETFNAYLEQIKTNASEYVQEMADAGLSATKPIMGAPNKDGVSQGVEDFISDKTKSDTLGGKKI